ncbi:hypothetical protein EJ06DRAFT_583485 [Trichodelitschia bisporula]|uniref:K Homology domain-containing protein n=1 Tax=Trichodelitschia bisporula TaxID=703511 RepID=A0A6G1HSH4_9PEZI|nr:hypothetical protein EJ06DRAFT_583485 [Trichodelitschia bisporula]
MASEAVAGASTTAPETTSAAQKLLAVHDQAHRVQVEDVPDEDDLAHPAPSSSVTSPAIVDSSTATAESDVAKGKQKAEPEAPKKKATPVLDTKSEEAFPALGAPKAAPAAFQQGWGKKPASVTTNGNKAGTNGAVQGSLASSRASTPGLNTPGSTVPSTVSLPGQHVERILFYPNQLAPRAQLKKPIPEIIRDINRRSKARIEIRDGANGTIGFEGKGPVDAVRQALKEVAGQIGSKQSVKVPIPASVRPFIIGRQGATIQAIQKRTGAKIQMPKSEEVAAPTGEDDDPLIDVIVEGDALAANMARQEIENIVNERTSTVNLRLRDIPAEFYPFLAGPNNARVSKLENGRDIRVQIPHYQMWKDQAPSQSEQGRPTFTPQASYPIQISGDRQAAQQVRQELENHARALRNQLGVKQIEVEPNRHQFIVGDKGTSLHDFLAETGCTVVRPPPGDDSEILYIVGPSDKLASGHDKVEELAGQMQSTSVDIGKQFANAPGGSSAHARNVTRYLRERQAVDALERQHNASIVLPRGDEAPSAWQIWSKDYKNARNARADILQYVNAHPPARLRPVDVDPFFHRHIREQQAQQLRRQHGVHIVFPDGDSSDLLLVYEEPGSPSEYDVPRQQPSPADIRKMEEAIVQAQKQLASMIKEYQDIVSHNFDAPPKYHDKIRRYVEREQSGQPAGRIPVQVQFQGKQGGALPLRGPSDAVKELQARLEAFIEQEKKDEVERGFTMLFDYPQKYAGYLVGKRGENKRKLEEEFDVEIRVPDGKVELKGPKAKCEACKSNILQLARKLEDEATFIIKVKPQYHRDLIGPKGTQVNRLQDRYNVRINFPRTSASPNDDADSNDAPAKNSRATQPQDEVVIKGPKRGAEEAREELLNLLQYVVDNSHSATVSVAQNQVPQLIGQGGREMENLRLASGCQIDVPSAKESAGSGGRVEIRLRGTKKQVEEAKKLLEDRVKTFDQTVTRTLDVDRQFHKALIGARGDHIRKIVVEAGGPDDAHQLARMVRFPRPDSKDNAIRLEGNKDVVDKVAAAIEAIVKQRESHVSEILEVAPEKHRLLIGRGGETRRNLESQLNVGIDIPKQGVTGPEGSQIKLTGNPDDVEKAKVHIANLVKEQEGETVMVPRRIHHVISDNGQFFRRLRNDHKVTVDHAGQHPPPKPAAPANRGRNTAAAPLITDDPAEAADTHSWELVDTSAGASTEEGEIPWILRGNAESVAKAKASLQSALEAAQKPKWTGYLILPDPKTYRLVVGPGGSQINSIRKKTGTRITVPKDQAKAEAIEIVGPKEGVEQARDTILEVVKNGSGERERRGRGERE